MRVLTSFSRIINRSAMAFFQFDINLHEIFDYKFIKLIDD